MGIKMSFMRSKNEGAWDGAGKKVKTSTAAQGNMEVEVWGMVTKAQEVARQLTEMTLAVPDQAQQVITNIYISMNNTMLAALETAENMIKLAQDATKEGPFSPFINAGLEQLNIATVELSKAMKRVSELLEKLNREQQQEREKKERERESDGSSGAKGSSRAFFKPRK